MYYVNFLQMCRWYYTHIVQMCQWYVLYALQWCVYTCISFKCVSGMYYRHFLQMWLWYVWHAFPSNVSVVFITMNFLLTCQWPVLPHFLQICRWYALDVFPTKVSVVYKYYLHFVKNVPVVCISYKGVCTIKAVIWPHLKQRPKAGIIVHYISMLKYYHL